MSDGGNWHVVGGSPSVVNAVPTPAIGDISTKIACRVRQSSANYRGCYPQLSRGPDAFNGGRVDYL